MKAVKFCQEWTQTIIRSNLRANKILLHEQKANNRLFEKSFLYQSSKILNQIPEDLKKNKRLEALSIEDQVGDKNNNINFPE